ncbi:hypothetical protein ABPG75_000774 [Micractinium tetrahymenae]
MPRLLAAVLAACLAVAVAAVAAAPARRPLAPPHLEPDWQQLRARCEGLDGGCVDESGAGLENCIRRCMSPSCYSLSYGEDALEEGEDDSLRGPRFRACVLREVRQARAVAAGLPPPVRVPGYKRYNAGWGGS